MLTGGGSWRALLRKSKPVSNSTQSLCCYGRVSDSRLSKRNGLSRIAWRTGYFLFTWHRLSSVYRRISLICGSRITLATVTAPPTTECCPLQACFLQVTFTSGLAERILILKLFKSG